jgi:hypothetical protein
MNEFDIIQKDFEENLKEGNISTMKAIESNIQFLLEDFIEKMDLFALLKKKGESMDLEGQCSDFLRIAKRQLGKIKVHIQDSNPSFAESTRILQNSHRNVLSQSQTPSEAEVNPYMKKTEQLLIRKDNTIGLMHALNKKIVEFDVWMKNFKDWTNSSSHYFLNQTYEHVKNSLEEFKVQKETLICSLCKLEKEQIDKFNNFNEFAKKIIDLPPEQKVSTFEGEQKEILNKSQSSNPTTIPSNTESSNSTLTLKTNKCIDDSSKS